MIGGAVDPMTIKFWGTRGSIPTPGNNTSVFGGNTSCIELNVGKNILIFDAGSGLRELGMSLNKRLSNRTIEAHIFITHTHWDHIQGFPFFEPAYKNGNIFHIYGGVSNTGKTLVPLFNGQMDQDYFPVSLHQMAASIHFHNLDGNPIEIDGIRISYVYVNHPTNTVGYRIEYAGRSVVYITDHEMEDCFLHPTIKHHKAIGSDYRRLISKADVFIADAQYSEEEYLRCRGWGHSTTDQALKLAIEGEVATLYLFHHDPRNTDDILALMEQKTQDLATSLGVEDINCFAAREGSEIML